MDNHIFICFFFNVVNNRQKKLALFTFLSFIVNIFGYTQQNKANSLILIIIFLKNLYLTHLMQPHLPVLLLSLFLPFGFCHPLYLFRRKREHIDRFQLQLAVVSNIFLGKKIPSADILFVFFGKSVD